MRFRPQADTPTPLPRNAIPWTSRVEVDRQYTGGAQILRVFYPRRASGYLRACLNDGAIPATQPCRSAARPEGRANGRPEVKPSAALWLPRIRARGGRTRWR